MLDTHICIFTIKNRPPWVREAFKRHHGQRCISTVTLMELIYGAEKSSNPNMIAGHARSRRLTIITNNRGEFDRVVGLRIEDWARPVV
ncbi:hypothetical protein ACI2KD_17780 [Pseudomonas monteilii]